MKWLFQLLWGGGGGGLPDQLRRAYEKKLDAANDAERIEAERDVQRITAAVEMARVAASDRWGATSIGRYLIVVPFGIWLTAIFVVSIINPNFGTTFVIQDVPPRVWDIMTVLVPSIIIGSVAERWRK